MTSVRYLIPLALCMSLAILAGCSTPNKTGTKGATTTRGGGYYLDDGPGSNIPPGLENVPDAVPRIETHSASNFRPYVVFGKKYYPVSDEKPFRQEGTASWYGRKFHGKKTANGETYDMYAMSAAHPTLPIPSYARVTNARTGKSVIVRVNDRGPFHSSRIIDVSYVAATRLGLVGPGSGQVIVEAITNADIRMANARAQPIQAAPRQPEPRLVAEAPKQPPPRIAQRTQPVPDALAALNVTEAQAVTEMRTGQAAPRKAGSSQAPADALNALQPQDSIGHISPSPTDSSASVVQNESVPGQIYLQFGAFSASHTADGLVQRLNRQIRQVESRPAQVNNANALYKVQIGPYPSRTAAVNAALRIQEATGMRPALALR